MKQLLKNLKAEFQTIEEAKLLVAVSGGMDSMLMAELLLRAKIPFAVAHVNYQLRGKDSEKDEQFVKAYCKKNKLTFHCAHAGDLWKASKNNLQERARDFRYNYFQQLQDEFGYTHVVLAHHANDQLETVLQHLIRGSGLKGLLGMKRHTHNKWRPLLEISKKELEGYAKELKLKWREDASNSSSIYGRNKIRNKVVPILEEMNPNILQTLSNSIEIWEEQHAIVQESLQSWLDQNVVLKGENELLSIAAVNNHYAPRQIMWEWLNLFEFTTGEIEEILKLQKTGAKVSNATYAVARDRDNYVLYALKSEMTLDESNYEVDIVPAKGYEIEKDSKVVQLNADKLRFPLEIRPFEPGDKIRSLGMKGMKKVSDVLVQAKIPLNEKKNYPVLVSKKEIVAVIGLCVSEDYKIDATAKKVFVMRLT
ncbi:MAG: tRNA lysidine(34) synthetase TilS [Bacteroidota bacterium]|jgi:tRNA(Ile)-lysidine synthase